MKQKKTNKRRSEIVAVSMSSDLLAEAKRLAKERELTLSAYVRQLIIAGTK